MSTGNASAWRTLRAFAAQVAEASAPESGASWVSVKRASGKIEVRVVDGASTGSTNPTGLTLSFWRKSFDTSGTAVIDKLADVPFVVSSNNVTEGLPFVLPDVGGDLIYVTVSAFVSGSTPALTATVQMRSLTPAA